MRLHCGFYSKLVSISKMLPLLPNTRKRPLATVPLPPGLGSVWGNRVSVGLFCKYKVEDHEKISAPPELRAAAQAPSPAAVAMTWGIGSADGLIFSY